MTTKLLVVDDHEMFREGLIKVVEGTEICVVAQTGSNQEALD